MRERYREIRKGYKEIRNVRFIGESWRFEGDAGISEMGDPLELHGL
jgi:hypothetical protein